MNILITGVPGTGKTEIAKALAKAVKLKVINDKVFAKKNNLGREKIIDSSKEYVVDLKKFNAAFKNKKQKAIYEGHLWSELSKDNLSSFDYIFVLKASKKLLIERQKKRKYPDIKIIENIFCQDTNYIPNMLDEKNSSFKIINVDNNLENNIKKIMVKIKWLEH